jgi:hypothetical protein
VFFTAALRTAASAHLATAEDSLMRLCSTKVELGGLTQ